MYLPLLALLLLPARAWETVDPPVAFVKYLEDHPVTDTPSVDESFFAPVEECPTLILDKEFFTVREGELECLNDDYDPATFCLAKKTLLPLNRALVPYYNWQRAVERSILFSEWQEEVVDWRHGIIGEGCCLSASASCEACMKHYRGRQGGVPPRRQVDEMREGWETFLYEPPCNILEELYPNPKQESELRYPLRGAQQLDTWQYMPSYTFFDDIYERIMNETYAREKGFKSLVTLERRVQALVEIARQVREAREAMAPLL